MLMIDPKAAAAFMKSSTYEECRKERNSVIRKIRRFEQRQISTEEWMVKPSSDTVYQWNLEYLRELYLVMSELETDKGGERL